MNSPAHLETQAIFVKQDQFNMDLKVVADFKEPKQVPKIDLAALPRETLRVEAHEKMLKLLNEKPMVS